MLPDNDSDKSKETEMNASEKSASNSSFDVKSPLQQDHFARPPPKQRRSPPLDPVQVFEEYKEQHSAQALRFTGVEGRKFLVSKFACPRQAGVHAIDYTTALLLAIATNRTLLHQYAGMGNWIQIGENAPEVCQQLLRQAEWIPSFDEFFPQLPAATNVHVMEASNNVAKDDSIILELIQKKQRLHDNINHELVIEPARLWGLGSVSSTPYYHALLDLRDHKASTYVSQTFGIQPPLHQQKRIQKLYSESVGFVYGMLFAESFAFTDKVIESVKFDLVPPDDTVFSIGMHSRHSDSKNDGIDNWAEFFCLDQLVQMYANDRPCRVYLMSDREETIKMVSDYATRQYNCTAVTVSEYTQNDPSEQQQPMAINLESSGGTKKTIAEHGFAAGAGYFQDLALVSGGARSAFASKRRSSSALIMELMEYHRRMEAWEDHGTRNLSNVVFCRIRKRRLNAKDLQDESSKLPRGLGPWAESYAQQAA